MKMKSFIIILTILIYLNSKIWLNERIIFEIFLNQFIFIFFFNKDRRIKTSNKSILNIFLILSLLILSESRNLIFISEITITIKGTETQQILSNYTDYCGQRKVNFQTLPDEIIINHNINHPIGKFVYDLVEETNEITMKWNNTPLTDCNGMFYGLSNITSIDFSNFDGSNLIDIRCMFGNCNSLTMLDLRNFNTSLIEDLDSIFNGCRKLEYLDISSFNTSKVKNMYSMFGECYSLKTLDVTHFDTSLVTNMNHMFFYCMSIKSLNLDNFNTSNVEIMTGMIEGCNQLTSLDLSSFNTSKCTRMFAMFKNCISLKSLNLSNFVTNSVTTMRQMFTSCNSLEYLDISSFNTSKVEDMEGMFKDCSSLISLNLYNFNTNNLNQYSNMFTNINSDFVFCVDQNEQSNIASLLSNYKNNNCSEFCLSYKQKKFIFETNECLFKCNNSNTYKYEYNNFCYISCPNGTISSNFNEFFCENDTQKVIDDTNIDNTFLIINNNNTNLNISSANNNECNAKNLFYNKCILNNNENNEIDKDNMIDIIRNGIKDRDLDSLIESIIKEKNEDLVIIHNDIIYQITSSFIQNNKEYDNISIIKLGDCEDKLHKKYDIDNDDPLLILKIDIQKDGLSIPLVEYEIYDIKSKKKLDLEVCNNTKIDILLPVSHVENDLFKHNTSSEYYKDICYTYTTDTGTDIILKDRKNEFINNNLSLCDSNCEYRGYDINIKMSKCECGPKNEIPKISKILIDKDKFLNKFVDINNIMNIKLLKCYKLLFSKEGIIYNIGSYIILSIILISIISNVIFLFKGFKLICDNIGKIIDYNQIKNYKNKIIEKFKEINNQKESFKKLKKIQSEKGIKDKSQKKSELKNKATNLSNINESTPPKQKQKKISVFKNYKTVNEENHLISKSNIQKSSKNSLTIINFDNNTKNKIENIKGYQFLKYNDQEINTLNYKEALLIDKRTYLQYYFSLIKRKQKLLFTFYTKDDYNSRIIKICLFFFSFALFYAVNALFFSDSTMHKIYEDNGKFNFIYQIPQILYSTIISSIINILVNILSLSERNIILFKKDNIDLHDKKLKIINCLKIKFILSFILIYIFLLFFWYYLSCFCVVYKNTQIYLIEDSLISFVLSLLYPFGLCLLPGLFRIPSLRSQNKNKEFLYKISKIVKLI